MGKFQAKNISIPLVFSQHFIDFTVFERLSLKRLLYIWPYKFRKCIKTWNSLKNLIFHKKILILEISINYLCIKISFSTSPLPLPRFTVYLPHTPFNSFAVPASCCRAPPVIVIWAVSANGLQSPRRDVVGCLLVKFIYVGGGSVRELDFRVL